MTTWTMNMTYTDKLQTENRLAPKMAQSMLNTLTLSNINRVVGSLAIILLYISPDSDSERILKIG